MTSGLRSALLLASLSAVLYAADVRAQMSARSPGAPQLGDESARLVALREAEREWDVPSATVADGASRVGTSLPDGLEPELAAQLQMPSLAVRVTPRIARHLALIRTDLRARRAMASWLRHSTRFRARIENILAAEGLPTELVWVVAAESGFNPIDVSHVGATGLWQLMPDAARTYGLRIDAWVDERRDPERSTHAAARMLRDLHTRFGTWELALAAYNMGYNALLRSIRRYNTNDFEALAAVESGLPWETVHYVPRILSAAIAAANVARLGLTDGTSDPPIEWEDCPLTRSVPLDLAARGAGIDVERLRQLNPALVRSRTPIADAERPFVLHVPRGSRARVETVIAQAQVPPLRSYRLRWGEGIDEVAARYDLAPNALLALSGLSDLRPVSARAELLVPDREPTRLGLARDRPVIAVAPVSEAPPAGRRVFYRVGNSDNLLDIARATGTRADEVSRWNALDPRARLQPGMWLQLFVGTTPADVRLWEESEVDLLERDSDTFHAHAASLDGRVRLRIVARDGDTMESVAQHYGITVGLLARINHRSRHAPLAPGDAIVVYANPDSLRVGAAPAASPAATRDSADTTGGGATALADAPVQCPVPDTSRTP